MRVVRILVKVKMMSMDDNIFVGWILMVSGMRMGGGIGGERGKDVRNKGGGDMVRCK